MPRIQVVYASRHGGTEGIAQAIGKAIEESGAEAVVVDAASHPDANGFDGYVVGSGVYMGAWLKDGLEYLERNGPTLADKPVWLFSSGPLPNATVEPRSTDPIENALGPADGPGSGGRKKVEALTHALQVRDHQVFEGAFNPDAAPTNLIERVVRAMPAIKKVLPAGDFRPWPRIDTWARHIATEFNAGAAPTG
jgi:menaquinone-dependent protoporphyrinogen oxidase